MVDFISVIIPTYNRATLISTTIESVRLQTHKNWECIVVDDGSTDNTFEVVTALGNIDSRIKIYKRPANRPKGANACRNYGFEKSSGNYINWLDSDDLLHPRKFETQLRALERSKMPFSISQTNVWDQINQVDLGLRNEHLVSESPLDDYIQFKIFWLIQSALWKRKTINEFKFNESLQQSQEYEYHIRILRTYPLYHTTDEVLSTIIVHNANISNSRIDRMDKLLSNLNVRYWALKNLAKEIKPETSFYLFTYFTKIYKEVVLKGDYKKALVCFKYMYSTIDHTKVYNGKKALYLMRWILAIPSFYFFKKGTFFLRTLKIKS